MIELLAHLQRGLARHRGGDRVSGDCGSKGRPAAFRFIKPHLRRHLSGFAFGLALAGSACAAGLVPPLLTRFIVDDVILAKQLGLLAGTVLLLAACILLEKLFAFFERLYFSHLEQRIVLGVQDRVVSRLLRLPKAFFDRQQTGYLSSRVTEDVEALRWLFSGMAARALSNCLRFVGGLTFLLYLEWRLAVATLLILPAMIALLRRFSRQIYFLAHQRLEQKAEADGELQQTLSTAPLIKAFAAEEGSRRRTHASFEKYFDSSLQQLSVSSLAELLISLMPSSARGIALVGGAVLIIHDQWTLGALLAFQAYLGFVFGPAQYLASANLQFQKSLAALNRVAALFDVAPEEGCADGIRSERLAGGVEFRNVDFAYNGRDKVLRDVSFRVRPGERTAVVGPSGAGKTSLVSLLLRFYRQTSGGIYFDGRAAEACGLASLRQRIGYVSQQPQLLSGTVRENLCFGNPDAPAARVVQAAMASGVHGFVKSLPDGYETVIGENGLSLSEGQKQRLSLARALVKDPDIFVLDEPTASLDGFTSKSLLVSLAELFRDKTVFVVTHSLAIVEKCDSVILIDDKGGATQSTHEHLTRTNPLYRKMFVSFEPVEGQFRAGKIVADTPPSGVYLTG